mgnify:FL=1
MANTKEPRITLSEEQMEDNYNKQRSHLKCL